jgi:large subunit ribosomal protein L32e
MAEKKDEAKADKKAAAPASEEEPKTSEREPKKASGSKESSAAAKAKDAPSGKAKKAPAATKKSASTPKTAKKAEAKTKEPAKKEPEAKGAEEEDVTIVDEGEVDTAAARQHKARIKPELDDETRAQLSLRRTIADRRPGFRRQQWFEYKRLERSGWRRPTGQDSAQRRHFGYRPNVVRVGYRGPRAVRGLHASGFEEVRVENVGDLARIDPKKQAARVSATVGRRKLKDIYEAADEKKIRILNRRSL